MKVFYLNFLAVLFFLSSAQALSPETRLADEKQEQRAMRLFLQVRCVVCGGQVIENSDTEFSFQMRQLIREKISAGKVDEEIKNELVKEFGQDILTKPDRSNLALWLLPLAFAVILFFALIYFSLTT